MHKNIAIITYLIPLLTVLWSCTKSIENNKLVKDKIFISFDVDMNSLDKQGSTLLLTSSENIIEEAHLKNNDFEAIITLQEINNNNSTLQTSKLNQHKKALTTQLEHGVAYRVIVYKNDGTYVETIDGQAGLPSTTIELEGNTTYKWIAYSFNQHGNIPSINLNNPILDVGANQDFIYTSGTLTPTIGENKIKITFHRKLGAIQVELDGRGMFAKIKKTILNGTKISTSTPLKSAKFSLKDSLFTNFSASHDSIFTWENVDQNRKDTVVSGYLISAVENTNGDTYTDFTIKIDTLTIILDDGNTRLFTNIDHTFSKPIKLERGKSYKASIKLIESAVNLEGVSWARGNLYYRVDDQGYRFRHNPTHYYYSTTNNSSTGQQEIIFGEERDFWQFNSYLPYIQKSIYQNEANLPSGDPCTRVFPYQVWRTPTASELETLTEYLSNGIKPKGYNLQNKIGWTYHQYTTSADAYGGNLYFNGFGSVGSEILGSNNTIDDQILTVSNGFYRSNGTVNNQSVYYWSSSINTITGKPVYMYFQNFYNAFTNSIDAHYDSGNLDSSHGMSIRCVRN